MDASPNLRWLRFGTAFGFFPWFCRLIFGQRIAAIAGLTLRAAFRFRLVPFLVVLLLVIVIGLPLIIKDDGTARGLTQIVLTYTLGLITTVLGLATLWFACGTLARDVEECQMQMVSVKPIARWQIWLGKWLGIVTLNGLLLALAGAGVFFLIQWRAHKLPAAQQDIIRNEIFVGREVIKPVKADVDKIVEENFQALIEKNRGQLTITNQTEVRKALREQVINLQQVVPPRGGRRWTVDLGLRREFLKDQPLFLRVKMFTSEPKTTTLQLNPKTYETVWQIGATSTPRIVRKTLLMPADSFQEFSVPPNMFDERGRLTVECWNASYNVALLFSVDDGFEVLYRESSFALNFSRGMFIVFLWLAALAALGLAAASFLSFPVAAFLSLTMLLIAISSGMLSTIVQENSIWGINISGKRTGIDIVLVPLFQTMLQLLRLAQEFSPIDSLSTGRAISWGQLGRAFAQIIILLGGLMALFGVTIFTRRELATAQGGQ